MLKIDKKTLKELEDVYSGIVESILRIDKSRLPLCTRCGSKNTAEVQVGLVGRSINIASATTKVKLIANNPKNHKYFCKKGTQGQVYYDGSRGILGIRR